MAKGSQLSQLKSALAQAGVSKQNQNNGKKRKRSVLDEKEKERKAAKLRDIQQKMNPFDVKVTKLKHDVGGRKIAGTMGKPAQSKQAGIERRKKTLLKEYEERDHAGGIVDRRFGENDPTMTPEERMLERFTRERQRASKGATYNLEDEDELTHYGQSLSNLDDFDNVGLGLDEEEEADLGAIDRRTVQKSHFGGFDDDEEEDEDEDGEPERKKSKAEVMSEVIAKSKEHKFARQAQQEEDESLRHQLDEELNDLRSLLYAPDPAEKREAVAEVEETGTKAAPITLPVDEKDQEYDQFKRAKPKDRTKTEEERALEEKEALEKAEKQRLRRMQGLEDSDDEDEGGKGKGKKRQRGGDDLDDDFMDEEEGDDEDEEGEMIASDYLIGGRRCRRRGESEALVKPSKSRPKKTKTAQGKKELPYTFPFPRIIEDIDDADVPTVVKRIRTLHHPSLAQDNKYKLQSAGHFVENSTSCRKISSGIIARVLDSSSKTWPGLPELSFLRYRTVWPTSDMNHPYLTRRLLMGSYLGSACQVAADLASGLFYLSKRLYPKHSICVQLVLHLAPIRSRTSLAAGCFPAPDSARRGASRCDIFEPGLALLEGIKVMAAQTNLDVYRPSSPRQRTPRPPSKFSRQSRRPLALQAHKAIPIPSYIPRFEHASSNYLRNRDPDHERNEASKLCAQVKQERKGAIRELRKDARFLAAEQQKKQKEKDKAYNDSMKRRAEQKAMEKAKARDKKRAGKK
ncbi:Nop14-like family-domain-containing protein [Irpex lacteus]|nr:Nop14-like family-domain-containing protein [Irpex lacteus]